MNKIIKSHWEQLINNAYFYRGMSLNNLDLESDIVLDPTKNPHENIIPVFMEYSELLFKLIENGLDLNVNDFYIEPLHKILTWTVRDIKNSGIDFTTNYADATSYAFNYAGSQIKHNFNLIVKIIHEYKNHKSFNAIEQQKFWEITKKIEEHLLEDNKIMHQPIVVKVKRSCKAFEDVNLKELNFGSYEFFFEKVKKEAGDNLFDADKIAFFLHQKSQANNFNIRLIKVLYKKDIEEIIYL